MLRFSLPSARCRHGGVHMLRCRYAILCRCRLLYATRATRRQRHADAASHATPFDVKRHGYAAPCLRFD